MRPVIKRIPTCLLIILCLLIVSITGSALAATDNVQEINVPNTPVKGKVLIEKTGLMLTGFTESESESGYTVHTPVYQQGYLEGAVFEIRAAENIVGKDGTQWYQANDLADTITTSGKEKTESALLPLGHYYLTEVSAPEGYLIDPTRIDVTMSFKDHQTAVVEAQAVASNEYMPVSISLTKQKEILTTTSYNGNMVTTQLELRPGENCVFGLFNKSDISYPGGTLPAGSLLATKVTSAYGKLTFHGYYPHGEFYVQELSAPEGWEVDPTQYPITISDQYKTDDNIIEIELAQPIVNRLKVTEVPISKTDITGSDYLPNTLIEVFDNTGETVVRGGTGDDGYLPEFVLIPGEYSFREVLAPEGYSLAITEFNFTVTESGQVEGITRVADDFSRCSIMKVDENQAPMAGVEFGLYKEDGTLFMTSFTNSNGLAEFEKIPYGEYFIQEKTPLPGYVRDYTRIPVSIDGTYINPSEPLATIENIPTEILLQKVDQDGVALPGAEYGLFDSTGHIVKRTVSDENGLVRFTHVFNGTYFIRETKAPDGYLLNRKILRITIADGYKNPTKPMMTLINQKKNIKFIKIDSSGQYLPGVAFALINESTGETVETVTSDSNGVFTLTKFDYGDWIVREVEAPDGYCRMEDFYFHVGDDWTEPEPFTLVNFPNHYEFMKVDTSGMPLEGVKFHLEDLEGNVLETLISDKDGMVRIEGLKRGTYIIREVETLEGFHVTGETIRLDVDENFKTPEKIKKLVNYTVIQTGANLAVTISMWIGFALMAASVGMIIFRNKRKNG